MTEGQQDKIIDLVEQIKTPFNASRCSCSCGTFGIKFHFPETGRVYCCYEVAGKHSCKD